MKGVENASLSLPDLYVINDVSAFLIENEMLNLIKNMNIWLLGNTEACLDRCICSFGELAFYCTKGYKEL